MSPATLAPTRRSHTPPPPLPQMSVEEIIDQARSAPAPTRGALTLSLLTAALMWAAFAPLAFGPLGWVCLVPLIQLIRLERPTRRMYRLVYAGGLAFSLAALQWMRLGDTWMYPAWIALSAYVALYFPLFVGLSRSAVHRWKLPLTLAVPTVWVGLEFARAHIMSGFAWYFLGHTQFEWNRLIQISDITGAYGVSFLVAMGNAALAACVPWSWLKRLGTASLDGHEAAAPPPRRQWIGIGATLALLGAALIYGTTRAETEFPAGPRVALIQGNFPSSLKHDPSQFADMFTVHRGMTGEAVKHQPDLIVWPETMFRFGVRSTDPDMTDSELEALHPGIKAEDWRASEAESRRALITLSDESRADLIIGSDALDALPGNLAHYNSAVFVDHTVSSVAGRYDKVHRVPFGEYIPLADTFAPLQQLFPFAGEMGISAGRKFHVFRSGGRRLVPMICFEDTVPHLVRSMVAAAETEQQVDCLVNLTNDGWFHGSSELDQHLATSAFRCVETRTPLVRAVNTGISAFIDGNGMIREPEVFLDFDARRHDTRPRTTMRDAAGRFHKQLNAVLVSHVPLDPRTSLYVAWGDWFAALCGAVCAALVVWSVAKRFGGDRSMAGA
ncbi:MAG: apolipoprotein N-acyltransferase [Planctomycetaceae bacterium]|nr:apolipoprotein N-acyltransferase [Planctomycetaceae bacterium]